MKEENNFNFIYEKMVDEPDNIIGLVAYGIYKRHKIDHIRKHLTTHGKTPSREELSHFHEVSCGHINGYTFEAVNLFNEFANNLLEEKIEELEEKYRIEVTKIKEEYRDKLEQQVKNNSLEVDKIIQKHNGWLKKVSSGIVVTFIVTALNFTFLFVTLLSQKSFVDIWRFIST